MAELVNAMRLAQQYSGTVVAGEYSRAMLSAARTLAVNAKQLLDVIDDVRTSATVFTLQRSPPDGASNYVQSPELSKEALNPRLQSDCVSNEGITAPSELNITPSQFQAISDEQTGASSIADCGFDMNSLLVNSDDEYDDEKFRDDDAVVNPDEDLLSSEADRCLEAVEETNDSDHDDDMENEDDINDDAMDILTSALKNLR